MAVTVEDAARLTEDARLMSAYQFVMRELVLIGHANITPSDLAKRCAKAALHGANQAIVISADRCDQVDETYGQCEREYGHPGFILDDRYIPPVESVETFAADGTRTGETESVDGYYEEYENAEHGGHYTTNYDDRRRPNGSHPWDL